MRYLAMAFAKHVCQHHAVGSRNVFAAWSSFLACSRNSLLQHAACQSGVAARQSVQPNIANDRNEVAQNSLVNTAEFSGDLQLRRTNKRASRWDSISLWHNPDEWTEEPEYPKITPPKGTQQYTQHHRLEMAKKVAALPLVREKRHFIAQSLPWLRSQTHPRDDGSNFAGNKEVMFRPANKKSRAWERKHFEAWSIPCHSTNYNALPFIQHLTKTDVFERHTSNFNDYYAGNDALVKQIMDVIELQLESTILTSMQEAFKLRENFDQSPGIDRPESYPWRDDAKRMIDAIFRLIQVASSRDEKSSFLQKAQFHKDALIEAYTWRSALHGFDKEQMEYQQKAASWCDKIEVRAPHPPWKESLELLPTENCFQLRGSAYRVLRHATPLPPIVARDFNAKRETSSSTGVAVVDEGAVALIDSPTTLNAPYDCFPPGAGYELEIGSYGERDVPLMQWLDASWPGNCNPFASMLMNPYSTAYEELINEELRNGEDIYELMCADMIATCFSQCTAQAHHLGFTFLNELHYPITTQYVMTDGQEWVLGVYQCNTHAVWQRDEFYGPYRNFAWIAPPTRLFDIVERDADDAEKSVGPAKIANINLKLVEQLVRMMIKSPQQMSEEQRVNLSPFLHDESLAWTTTVEEVAASQEKAPDSIHHIVSEAFADTKTDAEKKTGKDGLPDSKDVQKVVGYVYRTPAGVTKKQRKYRHNGYLGVKYSYYHR